MNQLSIRFLTSIFLIIIIFLSLKSSTILFLFIILISYFSLIEFYYIFDKIFKKNNFYKFISISVSLIYVSFFSLLVWTYLIPHNAVKIISLLLLLIICASTDIGGFIIGKFIGGKKITKISPNKTYSGVIGSFLFSLIFGYSFYYYLGNLLKYEVNIIFIIIVISSVSQLGDLTISFLKRRAKIKDTGTILPGHGGILDRIDGILFALPVGFLILSV